MLKMKIMTKKLIKHCYKCNEEVERVKKEGQVICFKCKMERLKKAQKVYRLNKINKK